jgi:threonine synthase
MSGAEVELTPGSISDAARSIRQRQAEEGWFDMSTLKEPYRLEGKKTIGYELMEQFRWRVPDVFICPVGGGMSLIGVWKALQEMEELGWINSKRPRMVAVQAEGCAPLAKAFEEGAEAAPPWPNPTTFAAGIRVPAPLGDFLILKTVRQSRGTALAVSDAEIYQAILEICRAEGLFACPEGAACWAALKKLRQARWVKDDETVVLLNTGAGVKYIDALTRFEQTLRT